MKKAYIDIDGDGDKKEPMKEAAKSAATQKRKVNSWEEEDVKRGRKFAAKGDMGHAEALFDDAHDSYNWKGGNYGHESMSSQMRSFAKQFSAKNPITQMKTNQDGGGDSSTEAADQLKRNQKDEGSVAKQTAFQNLLQKYPDMPASDTLAANDPRENMGWPTAYSEDLNKAFNDTYGDIEGWEIEDGDYTEEEARIEGAKQNAAKLANAEKEKVKDSLYREHLKKMSEEEGDDLPTFAPVPQNKTMAYKKSCAYRHDGHGQSKGDQSATHTDYAHYKGTDKGYHGKTGASHGDQSATHRDYAHPILKHMKR